MGRRRHGGRAIGPRLSRVTKAAGAHPPGRGREEADRVGFDLINARIPPAKGGSARRQAAVGLAASGRGRVSAFARVGIVAS